MYNPAEYKSLLDAAKPRKSRWRGYWELMRLNKPIMGNTLMFWPCGKCFYSFKTPFPRRSDFGNYVIQRGD